GKTNFKVKYTIERYKRGQTVVEKGIDKLKRILFKKGKEKISSSYIRTGNSMKSEEYFKLDISNLMTGNSVLRIEVTDITTGEKAAVEKEFLVIE
ncbi:hypothetical protein DRQ09_07025, partial [candidate division KSB1 bacterium]